MNIPRKTDTLSYASSRYGGRVWVEVNLVPCSAPSGPALSVICVPLINSYGWCNKCHSNCASILALFCCSPQDMHVISTDENQVFVAIQEWNQNETYNLYISDTRGIFFSLALENVKSIKGPEGNVMIDLYEVCHGSMEISYYSIGCNWLGRGK